MCLNPTAFHRLDLTRFSTSDKRGIIHRSIAVRKLTLVAFLCVLCVLCVLSCGCATGFDRTALQDRLKLDIVESDEGTGTVTKNDPAVLRFPSKIAVYLQPSNTSDWHWSPKDKATLETLATKLKAEGIASELVVIPEMIAGKGSMKELQAAALRCGAETLFLVHGAYQTDKYLNPAAVFNLTIVGGYLIPASHRDSLFMIEACLIDSKSGYVFAGIQTEGEGHIIRPTFTRVVASAVFPFGLRARLAASTSSAARKPLMAGVPTMFSVPAAVS